MSPKKQKKLFKKVMNNDCYIDSSQSYCLYQIRIYLYQVAKGKQNGTNIGHSK